MGFYYAFYNCDGTGTIPDFYSNTNPNGFPGYYAKFQNGLPDPDFWGVCFHIAPTLDIPPPPNVANISWSDPLLNYDVFNSCDQCKQTDVVQILENCDDSLDIICLQNTLALGTFVQYNGKCYTVKEVPSCSATIPITYSTGLYYKTCESCKQALPQVNYALINCDTGDITYTSTDLSAYVTPAGQAITISGSDACFQVTVEENIPPGTPVTVTDSFLSCELCGSDYYLLKACPSDDTIESIVTYTDLSAYVGGVITLATCPDICWEVSETELNSNAQEVQFLGEYTDCEDCNVNVLPAICVTFTNISSLPEGFSYIDSLGSVEKITLAGNASIEKVCALSWDINTFITVTQFGNCVNGECPPVPEPKRKVTPGYDTPACSTEYYERVECSFSEWMYKDVLERRYGISNCCPEDLMKWEIKHEMLMLDVLINPDYTCAVSNTCGCPQPCDCGYLSHTVSSSTCNSQTN
jgi:hypothetical protein